MKYRDLFQFDSLAEAARLAEADSREGAARLLSTWVLSHEMAGGLTDRVFPNLQLDEPPDPKALLVVGKHGTGKTHWLAAVSSLAEHGDLAGTAARLEGLTADPTAQAEKRVGVDAVAGRFRVLRIAIPAGNGSVRETLLDRIEQYLASQGVGYSFPPEARAPNAAPCLDEMMAAFHRRFPAHGLMVVVDELFDCLRDRTGPGLISDLQFLGELGGACGRLRFRFMAGASEALPDPPWFGRAADRFRELERHFDRVLLGPRETRIVVAERLVPKTPAQKAQVEEYLARFAAFYGTMSQRMSEFVALFPIHPDYLEVCGQMALTEPRDILRALSDRTKTLLDATLPQDRPGLIAYDDYWETVRRAPVFREAPETEAVIESSDALERDIEKSVSDPERKAMALRLLHALSVHRLTTDHIYSAFGPTPAELRDRLCLYHREVEAMGNQPADDLLLYVSAVLDLVRKSARRRLIAYDADRDRYYLHFRHFRRFVKPELLLHWVNAVPFVTLMTTGGLMLISRFWHLDPKTFARVVLIHKVFAGVWVIGLPLVLGLRPRVHRLHLGAMVKWGVDDLLWLVQSVRSLYNKQAVVAPAGRFNTGQKINACLVMLYFLGFAATGALMHFKGVVLLPWYVHAALFFASLNTVGGHLFLSLVNPSTRVSLPGIFHGWSPMEYIEHHHPLSHPRSRHAPVGLPHARQTIDQIFASKVKVLMLAASCVTGLAGVLIFHQGLMASAKLQFEKSFSALISPRQLSTKHRLGPSAERCTKCHTYAGGIPDASCEQCHPEIKDRRTRRLGYHGSLTGYCIQCHKEHPDGTNSIIPLLRQDFKHDLTGFALEGKHGRLECDECHKKKRAQEAPGLYYIGLKRESCADCHDEPHGRQFTVSCEKCHSADGWTGKELKFNHAADSSFKLAGKHAALECAKCHQPGAPEAPLGSARFKGLPQDCGGCHEDPHRKQFAASCATCHSPAGWKKEALAFDHNKDSKFPLVARHAQVACDKCHLPASPGKPLASARFHGLGSACTDCHPDPHWNQFEPTCTKCHSPKGWKQEQLSFDHNRDSKFLLTDKHAEAACQKCHRPADPGAKLATAPFRGLKSECADCHKDPHGGQFERACTACHPGPVAWSLDKLQFEHARDTKFALRGKHASVDCIKCHPPRTAGARLGFGTFKGLGTGCESCHKVKHPDDYGPTCLSCHQIDRWPRKNPGPDHILKHNVNDQHLSGRHLTAQCRACHEPSRIAELGQVTRLGLACNTCHHKNDPHRGTLGTQCAKCHLMEGWKGEHLLFNHNLMTSFVLDQDHRKLACSKCHAEGRWKPLSTACVTCHPKFYGPGKQ